MHEHYLHDSTFQSIPTFEIVFTHGFMNYTSEFQQF